MVQTTSVERRPHVAIAHHANKGFANAKGSGCVFVRLHPCKGAYLADILLSELRAAVALPAEDGAVGYHVGHVFRSRPPRKMERIDTTLMALSAKVASLMPAGWRRAVYYFTYHAVSSKVFPVRRHLAAPKPIPSERPFEALIPAKIDGDVGNPSTQLTWRCSQRYGGKCVAVSPPSLIVRLAHPAVLRGVAAIINGARRGSQHPVFLHYFASLLKHEVR